MKKISCFILFSFILFNKPLIAQNAATPNPGFENWVTVGSYEDPQDWYTLNQFTAIVGILTAQKASGADAHNGSFAIHLTTKLVFGQNANGITSTSPLSPTPPYISGGIPYTARPDSITGWLKGSPMPGDTAFVEFNLFDGSATTLIGYATYNVTSNVNAYTRFSVPMTYYSAATPAISRWILSSSGRVTRIPNSTLYVDDVDLVFNPSGIDPNENNPISAFYNFSSHSISLKNINSKNYNITVFDMLGKKMLDAKPGLGDSEISLKNIPHGTYSFIINDDKGAKIKSSRFVIE